MRLRNRWGNVRIPLIPDNRYVTSWVDLKDVAVAYLVPYCVFAAWRRFPYWHRWYWRHRDVA